MLYDINFIIGLLITVLLSTFAYFYFSQKIDEQNEKLNAISMVVRAMAEEMTYFRNSGQSTFTKEGTFTEDRGAAETKVFEIDLANVSGGGSQEMQLIAVSDDEDSDSDSDSDNQSGSDDDNEDDDTELCSVTSSNVDLNDVEELDNDFDNKGLADYKKEENNENNENLKSIKLNMGDLEEFGIFEELGETSGKPDDFFKMTETKVVDVAGLQPLLDDDHMKANSTDYKKMPLSKLRSIVVEKKLCEDSSKMKKTELLELLKQFIGIMD